MRKLLGNAFSFNMVESFPVEIKAEEVSIQEAAAFAETAESVVGHAATADVFSSVLGTNVAFNRATVQLGKGDVLLVGQYRGPRLEEGTTELPEGASISWLRVTVL